ncbi:MAG: hypothetical protein ACREBI_08745 [Nitrosotalea sp.]
MSRVVSPTRSGLLVMVQDDTIKKALVGLAIEKALLDIGKPALDKVTRKLEAEYNCYIFDCYNNPKMLHRVLKEIYGNACKTIVDSIKKNLDEFAYQEPIGRFLSTIDSS